MITMIEQSMCMLSSCVYQHCYRNSRVLHMSRNSDKLNIIDHETFLKLQHIKKESIPKIIRNAKYRNKHKSHGQQFPLLSFLKRQEKPQQSSRLQFHIKSKDVTVKRKGKTRLVSKPKISRLKQNILNYRQTKKDIQIHKQELVLGEILNLQLQTSSASHEAATDELIPEVQQLLQSMTLNETLEKEKQAQDIAINKTLAAERQITQKLSPDPNCTTKIQKVSSVLTSSSTEKDASVPRSVTHSRRFRSYCDNCTSPTLANLTIKLLSDLQRFQKRAIANNSIKALAHLRYVVGFREAISYLRIKKVKLLFIATDCEPCPGKGGLDETIDDVKFMCQQQNVPYCFPMGRRKLNYTLKKNGQISCVAILDYDGSNATYAELIEALNAARAEYNISFGSKPSDGCLKLDA